MEPSASIADARCRGQSLISRGLRRDSRPADRSPPTETALAPGHRFSSGDDGMANMGSGVTLQEIATLRLALPGPYF